jgi:SAM-dependent methyltransferase
MPPLWRRSATGLWPPRRRTSPLGESDHVGTNRSCWNELAAGYVEAGRRNWASATPTWGVYGIEERRVLDEVDGLDAVELGCGTAYVSAWLLRLGARSVVGLDNSPAQLATARQLQTEFDLRFALVQADAERAPLRSGSFDLAVSEYGAAIWCDPYRWIPEAARLLRPGGRLVFLGNSTLLMLCAPDEDEVPASTELVRPQRGMHRFEWPDDPGVEFHLSHGDMIRLLRTSGFEVQDLIELYPDEGATTTFALTPPSWATRWPVEEVWIARKLG